MTTETLDIRCGPPRPDDGLPSYVLWNGQRYTTPAFGQIEAWVYDSVCEALDGTTIEPDGTTHLGCPSWLLALGLI